MMRYWGPRHLVGYQGMGVGSIITTIFWMAIIFIAVLLITKALSSREQYNDSHPLDILKERYAKGEITKKEFEEMKKDIS